MSYYSQLTGPLENGRRGSRARVYWAVLAAGVLLVGLQAVQFLRGSESAETDAAASSQKAPAEIAAAPKASSAPQAPVAPEPAAQPVAASPPAASTDKTSSAAPGALAGASGELSSIGLLEESPPLPREIDSSAATTSSSQVAATATPLSSDVQPADLNPAEPPSRDGAKTQLPANIWAGVTRLISAVTKVNLTASARNARAATATENAAAEYSAADEPSSAAIPEDYEYSSLEPAAIKIEQPASTAAASRPADPRPATPAEPPSLVLVNPRDSGGTIRFLVDGESRSLRPGESQTLNAGQSRIVFHRGGDFGNSEAVLRDGTYQFRVTKHGWTLAQQ